MTFCKHCSRSAVAGSTVCWEHQYAEYVPFIKDRRRRRYYLLKAARKCVRCSGELDTSGFQCKACRGGKTISRREDRIKAAEARQHARERERAAAKARPCICGQPRMPYQTACRDCYEPRTYKARVNTADIDKRMGIVPGAPRCKCGLLLPCESCLPSTSEVASWRPGSASGWAL